MSCACCTGKDAEMAELRKGLTVKDAQIADLLKALSAAVGGDSGNAANAYLRYLTSGDTSHMRNDL